MATQHGFWVAAHDNRVFDGFVTRHLITYGDIIVVNAHYQAASYSFANIVHRLKLLAPSVRVLFYTWAGRKPMDGDMIGAVPTLEGMENRGDLLLRDKENQLVKIPSGNSYFILLDPRKVDARTWLRNQVSTVKDLVASDGVALDSAIRKPDFLESLENPDEYSRTFSSMIQEIWDAVPETIFNNLAHRRDQVELLNVANGASIERFGLNDRIVREATFADDILPYLDIIQRHRDKQILVFGRASREQEEEAYATYDEDWEWQRYLYCAYLLAIGPNTRWKQHAGFLTSPFGGRAGGLEVYADALHDLGELLGDYTVQAGCYRRDFQRGQVLVVPAESPAPVNVSIAQPMYTPEGASVADNVTVAPRQGALLLQSPPARPPVLNRQFGPWSNPLWGSSSLQREGDFWYLHVDRTLEAEQGEHDLALELVRYRLLRPIATVRYRTSDAGARIETVIEVDDERRETRFALVDGSLPMGPRQDNQTKPGQFRGAAPDRSQFESVPVIGGGTRLRPDGEWRSLVMDLRAACTNSGRGYQFRRAVFMRLIGSLDVRSVALYTRALPARTRGEEKGFRRDDIEGPARAG
jgi:hypothetical protein